MVLFNTEFILWTLILVAGLLALAYIFVAWLNMDFLAGWWLILLAAAAIVVYVLRWLSQFLVRLTVDYDANDTEGMVYIQRFIPSATEPELAQFPLQQVIDGSPQVNTSGMLNTIISQLRGFTWLRQWSYGDLTLRTPAFQRGVTIYNIRDPIGVKLRMERDWKKINSVRTREKQVAWTRTGVAEGLRDVLKELKNEAEAAPVVEALMAAPAVETGAAPPAAPGPEAPPASPAAPSSGELKSP